MKTSKFFINNYETKSFNGKRNNKTKQQALNFIDLNFLPKHATLFFPVYFEVKVGGVFSGL